MAGVCGGGCVGCIVLGPAEVARALFYQVLCEISGSLGSLVSFFSNKVLLSGHSGHSSWFPGGPWFDTDAGDFKKSKGGQDQQSTVTVLQYCSVFSPHGVPFHLSQHLAITT